MRYLLFGSGGLLGSALTQAIRSRGGWLLPLRPPWEDASAAGAYVAREVAQALASRAPTTVVWAAGIGRIGPQTGGLSTESALVRRLCDSLASLTPDQRGATTLILASSGGALFGGHGPGTVSSDTPPHPITEYGFEKLLQEDICRHLALESGVNVMICRYSNLYGLTGSQLRPKGLIATAVLAARRRAPMAVFVSPDNRRDYIHNTDAAQATLAHLDVLKPGFHIRVVASGQTRTVAEVIRLVGRVMKRRVPATYAENAQTRLQPPVLRFHPDSAAHSGRDVMPLAIQQMAWAPVAR